MSSRLPLLLVQGADVPDASVLPLQLDPRVHLIHSGDLRERSPTFTARAARATIVATTRDPGDELVYVRTAGFTGPVVLLVQPEFLALRDALLEADVLEVLPLPLTAPDLDRALALVDALPLPPLAYPALDLTLDWVDHTASHGEEQVSLSQRQFALLHCLVQNGSRPVPIKEILEYVWGTQRPYDGSREIVDVNVSQLRKRLAQIGLREAIVTYRGFGYGLART